jgi:hypothetical protein
MSKPLRRYRVEETLTIVGSAEVEATSKAEAHQKIMAGEVEFFWNDGQDVRRGDGIHIFFEEFVEGRP